VVFEGKEIGGFWVSTRLAQNNGGKTGFLGGLRKKGPPKVPTNMCVFIREF